MDTERFPTALRQPEVTSPVHGLGEENSGTIQTDPFNSYSNVPPTIARIDPANLGPSAPLSSTSSDKLDVNETSSLQPLRNNGDRLAQPIQSSIRLPELNSEERGIKTNDGNKFPNQRNGIDWTEPKEAKGGGRTVGERLQPTLDNAIFEKNKYSAKAKWTGYTLNAAIGAQVLLGSLTTGLSALAASGGQSAAKATTALGALATLVAAYLARARGSNEPELSITRTKDLDHFIRECRSFQLDHGHLAGNAYDPELIEFRRKFEELLGNANGERKLSTV